MYSLNMWETKYIECSNDINSWLKKRRSVPVVFVSSPYLGVPCQI